MNLVPTEQSLLTVGSEHSPWHATGGTHCFDPVSLDDLDTSSSTLHQEHLLDELANEVSGNHIRDQDSTEEA